MPATGPSPAPLEPETPPPASGLRRLIHRAGLSKHQAISDLIAGVAVTIVLLPQGMAYALLAGLPPQVGLYAGLVPALLYALTGSSHALSVGPVAIVSLMVADGLHEFAAPGSPAYLALALTLALLVGLIQIVLGVVGVGRLIKHLDHAVLAGFTSAAALIICASQLEYVTGIPLDGHLSIFATLEQLLAGLPALNPAALLLAGLSILILRFFRQRLPGHLHRRGVPERFSVIISKGGPLVVALLSMLLVAGLALHETAGLPVVGAVPSGLPPLAAPPVEGSPILALLPHALVISFVSFLESITIAVALARTEGKTIHARREFIAVGIANIGAAWAGGYPIAGSFSRSAVNMDSGAKTRLAAVITASLIGLTLTFLMPVFYLLPRAAVAAIVIVAAARLIRLDVLREALQLSRSRAIKWLVTFGMVLWAGVEIGILAGVVTAVLLRLWRRHFIEDDDADDDPFAAGDSHYIA